MLEVPPEVLLSVGVAFAFVTGANDGGALVAPGLRVPVLSVRASILMLTVALIAFPALVSTVVADTLAGSIVPAGRAGATAVAIGFLAAAMVVTGLAYASLPTSLTLAVIGGIAGSGLGSGLPVAWAFVSRVLAIGIAAPLVGTVLALLGAWAWRTFRNASYLATVRGTHVLAFGAQCVAYGANDGQKVLVLFLAASMAAGDGPTLQWWVYPVVAAGFVAGTVVGLPRVARSVGSGILSTRPTHAVTAEFAAAAAVLGSAAVGTPVSMTQSVVGGLFGAGMYDSVRRIRWRVVANLALAWMITLPTSFGVAAAGGLIVGALT